ncbi:MAG: YbfB/YjiJ family MFS transporter [Burkholderiaceae bacterium]
MGVGRFAFAMLPLMLEEGLLDVAQGGWLAATKLRGIPGRCDHRSPSADARRNARRSGAAGSRFTAAMATVSRHLGSIALLGGVASAWAFVATSVWCLGALAQQGAARLAGWIYAGVGGGIAIAGLHYLFAAAAGVRSPALWLQLGGLALLLALPVFAVIARMPPASGPHGPRSASVRFTWRRRPYRTGDLLRDQRALATSCPLRFCRFWRTALSMIRVFGLAWPIFGATAALSTLLVTRLLHDSNRLRIWAAYANCSWGSACCFQLRGQASGPSPCPLCS